MSAPDPIEPTAELISRLRGGDERARNDLFARYLPILQQWARGRVPPMARGMNETDDFVQSTLVRVLKHVDRIQVEREGAFLAYLRTALMNGLRDEVRLAAKRVQKADEADRLVSEQPSPVDRIMDQDAFEAYEKALAALPPEQQEAVMLRLEFQMSYAEVAEAVGLPSADAARMKVSRAVARLAEVLKEHRG